MPFVVERQAAGNGSSHFLVHVTEVQHCGELQHWLVGSLLSSVINLPQHCPLIHWHGLVGELRQQQHWHFLSYTAATGTATLLHFYLHLDGFANSCKLSLKTYTSPSLLNRLLLLLSNLVFTVFRFVSFFSSNMNLLCFTKLRERDCFCSRYDENRQTMVGVFIQVHFSYNSFLINMFLQFYCGFFTALAGFIWFLVGFALRCAFFTQAFGPSVIAIACASMVVGKGLTEYTFERNKLIFTLHRSRYSCPHSRSGVHNERRVVWQKLQQNGLCVIGFKKSAAIILAHSPKGEHLFWLATAVSFFSQRQFTTAQWLLQLCRAESFLIIIIVHWNVSFVHVSFGDQLQVEHCHHRLKYAWKACSLIAKLCIKQMHSRKMIVTSPPWYSNIHFTFLTFVSFLLWHFYYTILIGCFIT